MSPLIEIGDTVKRGSRARGDNRKIYERARRETPGLSRRRTDKIIIPQGKYPLSVTRRLCPVSGREGDVMTVIYMLNSTK